MCQAALPIAHMWRNFMTIGTVSTPGSRGWRSYKNLDQKRNLSRIFDAAAVSRGKHFRFQADSKYDFLIRRIQRTLFTEETEIYPYCLVLPFTGMKPILPKRLNMYLPWKRCCGSRMIFHYLCVIQFFHIPF